MSNIKDYFDYYEETPLCVQYTLLTYCNETLGYKRSAELIQKLEKIGWTAECSLDGEPVNLHPIPT